MKLHQKYRKKILKNIFWNSNWDSSQTQLFYLLTQSYRSLFLPFIAYFNHHHPSELIPFILYPIFNSQITKNSIYPLRTSNFFQIESNKVRTKSVQTRALCVAKENALLFLLLLLILLLETSFEKMASGKFRKYPEARMLFLTKIFLISKPPTGHAFYFFTRSPPITRSYSSPSFVETSFFSPYARVISAKWFPFIATRCSHPLVSRFITREEVKLRGFMVVEVRLEDVF